MKSVLLVLVFFALSFDASAQITRRNILENKYKPETIEKSLIPKKQWNPYPKSSEDWRKAVPDSILKKLVKEGETALAYKFESISATTSLDYVRSGDRKMHQHISFGKRQALIRLILAESIEDKGRFTEVIMNGIWSICEESYWGVPAHIPHIGLPDIENPIVDLFAAETASVMALADYFVGEKLDKINKLIRKRIYYETNRRVFEPMSANPGYVWMSKTKPVNNWNPWIMSNWILSNLLLEKDEARRARMVYAAMVGLDSYLNSLGEDGGCDEGPGYWSAAGGAVCECLELLQKATNNAVNIFDNPLIKKMASYIYKVHIGNSYSVNISDADIRTRLDGLMLYRYGKALNDEKMAQFGKWAWETFPAVSITAYESLRGRRIQNFLTIQKIDHATPSYQPVSDAWISDIQLLTARTKKGLFMAVHGGHNDESHNHNDVGDFIIYLNGHPIIVDAGAGVYTARTFSNKRYELWNTQSEYHNLPIINGAGQKAGREFEAKNVKSTINEKEVSLSMDIASAYPKEAGISSWNRLVKLNRKKNQVELSEEYALLEPPKSIEQVFMTLCEADISEKGKIKFKGENNSNMTLNYDAKLWEVKTDKPSTEGAEYRNFEAKWNNHSMTRIILSKIAAAQKGKYQFIFEVGK